MVFEEIDMVFFSSQTKAYFTIDTMGLCRSSLNFQFISFVLKEKVQESKFIMEGITSDRHTKFYINGCTQFVDMHFMLRETKFA